MRKIDRVTRRYLITNDEMQPHPISFPVGLHKGQVVLSTGEGGRPQCNEAYLYTKEIESKNREKNLASVIQKNQNRKEKYNRSVKLLDD